jgi:ATP-dependent DNA helicase PIF1
MYPLNKPLDIKESGVVDFAKKLEELRAARTPEQQQSVDTFVAEREAFQTTTPVEFDETVLEQALSDSATTLAISEDQEAPCACLTGCAGSGKTYTILQRTAADPTYGILCSSTGISAVNLGAITINSLLGYFDTNSMRDAWIQGRLQRVLHMLAKQYRWLILDEMSMYSGYQLTILYRALVAANKFTDIETPMGILLSGDFCQLPPIHEPWAFESEVWPRFQAGMEVLTKVWRQQDAKFLLALNATRGGQGGMAAEILSSLGARWETAVDGDFTGTTILPKNDMVSRYNEMRLDKVPGSRIKLASRRWGKQRPEWGMNSRTKEWGVPQVLDLKVGAYVMLLANEPDGDGGFRYVNGDCGYVVDIDTTLRVEPLVTVRLVRNGQEVEVYRICRMVEQESEPEGFAGPRIPSNEDDGGYIPRVHFRGRRKQYVLGQVEYFPIRLAYASTVHKSQSLTLDSVQVDFRNRFFGSPAMLYTALSRCRTFEGLRLVGSPEYFVKHCKIDEKVRPWL